MTKRLLFIDYLSTTCLLPIEFSLITHFYAYYDAVLNSSTQHITTLLLVTLLSVLLQQVE